MSYVIKGFNKSKNNSRCKIGMLITDIFLQIIDLRFGSLGYWHAPILKIVPQILPDDK